jgi:hypothetical protein
MDAGTDEALHRIEALPGAGRYAVTFRAPNGAEQVATVRVDDDGATGGAGPTDAADIDVAQASLPARWRRDGDAFALLAAAVRALDAAARFAAPARQLVDVDGGWDVSLGNVVLGVDAEPQCIAHGPLSPAPDGGTGGDTVAAALQLWSCAECGARAGLRR